MAFLLSVTLTLPQIVLQTDVKKYLLFRAHINFNGQKVTKMCNVILMSSQQPETFFLSDSICLLSLSGTACALFPARRRNMN